MSTTETEEKANRLPCLPRIVYVFSFIWFLLLHKSLLVTFTLRGLLES